MRTTSLLTLAGIVFALVVVLPSLLKRAAAPPYDPAVCAGPPLKTTQARQEALEKGYTLDKRYGCIDKESFVQVNREREAWEKAHAAATEQPTRIDDAGLTLKQARQRFTTSLVQPASAGTPLPSPPSDLFVATGYPSGKHDLPAFITPDPGDGETHPAIIWLTGGDTNTLDDFWTPGPESNDQSASEFRKAGFVMLFPTLRGGNANPGGKEFFYGEVDDVLAAAEYLARQPYVDANRIYLGGHSTGGTLALLVAETSDRFRAVFAFGPVADVASYGDLLPVNFTALDARERKLRSPGHWLHGITKPTYLIEGAQAPGNSADVREMCAQNRNPLLRCVVATGYNHFSVLSPVSRVIATRLAMGPAGTEFVLPLGDFEK